MNKSFHSYTYMGLIFTNALLHAIILCTIFTVQEFLRDANPKV